MAEIPLESIHELRLAIENEGYRLARQLLAIGYTAAMAEAEFEGVVDAEPWVAIEYLQAYELANR